MTGFSALIDRLGAPRLASVFRIDESHVRTMKARESVPPEYWGLLIEEAQRQRIPGINWKNLRAMREQRFRTDAEGPRRAQAGRR